MTFDENSLLAKLREWRCLNCEHVHTGETSHQCSWRWCPKCRASSRRTHAVTISVEEGEFRERKLREIAAQLTAEVYLINNRKLTAAEAEELTKRSV